MSRKTMICVSGGMDSIWLAWHTLTTTADTVFLHHVEMQGNRHRRQAEREAFNAATGWLRDEGFAFTKTISEVDVGPARFAIRGPTIPILHAAGYAAQAGFGPDDRILCGRNCDDDADPRTLVPRHLSAEQQALRKPYSHHSGRQHLVDLVFEGDDAPRYREDPPDPTRKRMCEELPTFLLDRISSCQNPRKIAGQWVPCGSQEKQVMPRQTVGCWKCGLLAPLLPRYRPENGWMAQESNAMLYAPFPFSFRERALM